MKLVVSFLLSLSLCAAIVTGVNYASAKEAPKFTVTAETPLLFDRAPGAHEVAVKVAEGDNYAFHNAVSVEVDRKPILLAQADTGSASSSSALPDAGSASAPAAAPAAPSEAPKLAPAPSADQVTKLWRGGAFLAAGVLALYLLLTLALKLDKKHAFYISAGLAGLSVVVDAINRGDTPTLGMLVTAFTTIAAIIVRGPEKKQTS